MAPGRVYHVVVDGQHGFPYGSFRGGAGVRITRRDGRAFQPGGFDAAVDPALAPKAVRPLGTRFVTGGGGGSGSGGSSPEGDSCEPFAYAGANVWDLMDTARYPTLRWRVDGKLDGLRREGVNVVRTWGFSLGKGETEELRAMRLHVSPGVYDESVFQGMDYALAAAAGRGMRLIVSLEDYWLSIDRYIEWSPTAGGRTDFYTDWDCRNNYRDHVRAFLNRRNTVTGVLYKDDPTIFAWNLMNEPRCTG